MKILACQAPQLAALAFELGHPPFPESEWEWCIDESVPKRKRRAFDLPRTRRDPSHCGHLRAGLSVARVEIDASGRIVVVTGNAEPSGVVPHNEWDDVR